MVICSMRYLILIVLDWISVPFPHGPADSVVVQNLIQNLGGKNVNLWRIILSLVFHLDLFVQLCLGSIDSCPERVVPDGGHKNVLQLDAKDVGLPKKYSFPTKFCKELDIFSPGP